MISILIPSNNEENIVKMLMETELFFPQAQIIVSSDRKRRGKGWALRESLREADGDFIVLIDGDLDIHPRMINRLLPFLSDYDVVVGKKEIKGLFSRRILTCLSRIYIRIFFGLNIDTQTGVKVFRRDAIFQWQTDSFAFDIEMLFLAKHAGKRIIEVPVEANIKRKAKLSSVIKCFTESVKLLRLYT